jgi:uncharacterized integral membrane protein
MATLIMLVLAGIGAALFANQNTDVASLTFGSYHLRAVPVYLIVLVAVLVGLLVAAVINLVNSLISSFEILGKDSKIKEGKKVVAELTKRIHQLELENTELKANSEKIPDEKSI